MRKKGSGDIALPAYLAKAADRRYVTTSGAMWGPELVCLAFALTIRNHGTVEAVRATAKRLASKVCMEMQPNMKKLARAVPDDKVIPTALTIINRSCKLLGIAPDVEFKENPPPPEAPRCHMKPMVIKGYHIHRHWRCQHCNHTKPLE